MSEDALAKEAKSDIQWNEDEIPLRGCQFTLAQIKAAYRELAILTAKEGERIIASLERPEGMSEDDFAKRNKAIKDDAFRITVSIIGFDNQTTYGETEQVFDSRNLPSPIRVIFFTNTTAYKRQANGADPPNRFSVWLHFDKPPLFDPNPLVSEPTWNPSRAAISADDLDYYRAAQNIMSKKLRSNTKWYSFIHEKFAYDVGLLFMALPYSLYWVTVFNDNIFPADGPRASFRVAPYIYCLGIALLCYRALFGYLKWAYPVNILEENKDRATGHRIALGAIVFGIFASGVKSALAAITGL